MTHAASYEARCRAVALVASCPPRVEASRRPTSAVGRPGGALRCALGGWHCPVCLASRRRAAGAVPLL